jgi:hypothetical protein
MVGPGRIARRVIDTHLNPRVLMQCASGDVASNICQALSHGMTECCGKITMSLLEPAQRMSGTGDSHFSEQLETVFTSGRPFRLQSVRVVGTKQNLFTSPPRHPTRISTLIS